MQLVGLALLLFVVSYGFEERTATTISAFDPHAFVMVLGGSLAAVMVSSSAITTLRTALCIRELVPGIGTLGKSTASLEAERLKITELWLDGRRAQAVELAEKSGQPVLRRMLQLVLGRAQPETTQAAFTELRHAEIARWQPAIGNWEILARLAPSFGMVGTITGMIQMFQKMGGDSASLGSALSLALVATLYGVAFGAGVAGPIGHYLRNLLDERLGAVERCEKSVGELVARAGRDASMAGG